LILTPQPCEWSETDRRAFAKALGRVPDEVESATDRILAWMAEAARGDCSAA